MLERAEQVLVRSRQGKSFGAVARIMGLERPSSAHELYSAHLRDTPPTPGPRL